MKLKHLFFTAIAVFAFAGGVHAQAVTDDTVFQAFGGKEGISKVIDDFLGIWQDDARINGALKDADVERLGGLLKQQFTQLTGGPAVYSGRSMKEVHDGMGLRNADFNALAEDLQKAMDKNNVPVRAQNKLLAKLAPMERQIVTK
ncbi:MAG: group 1 truncated hemoglobin [Burkholderiaceae bacterium]|nr:group 1 truncated hemoglobin [Burkholderiaceae bacterium]